MAISRRGFLKSTAAIAAAGAGRSVLGQTAIQVAAPAAAPATQPIIKASAGTLAWKQSIPAALWDQMPARLGKVNSDMRTRGLRNFPGATDKLITGYPYNEYYDWDLYFENMYMAYYGIYPYCFSNLRLFLDRQQPDGYVNRSLIKQRDRQHFKPFLAQLVVLGCRMNNNNFAWVEGNYYTRLSKYLDKWMSYDGDHNGLPTWNSADAAGTDNQWSRGGPLSSFQCEGVDLASYLIREYDAMAAIATALNKPDDVKQFTAKSQKLAQLINDVFWDEKEGFYYDRNEKTGAKIPVKSGSGFMPLFAGAATPERAKRIVNEHLLNEKEFWLSYPIASYAKTEPDYYQGSHNECNWRGSTWAPYNYMAFHGLVKYGLNDVAKELSNRLFEMAMVKNTHLWEYYNAETGAGLGHDQFWGFTALYYVMPLEFANNYDPSDLIKPIRKFIPEELGVPFQA